MNIITKSIPLKPSKDVIKVEKNNKSSIKSISKNGSQLSKNSISNKNKEENNNYSHKSCPYVPKKVLTDKQAEKEPVGTFYHPTNKTFRSGACDAGYVLKKGYERKAYTKKDGTHIKATYVGPVCIKDKGMKGKLLEQFKPIHLENKGELLHFGYNTTLKNYERLTALIEASKELTYKSVILRINALRILNKNNPKFYKIYDEDMKNLQLFHKLKEFGYDFNIPNNNRLKYLKKASEELTSKKVISILKKLKKIYNEKQEISIDIIEKDILHIL
jgi:asparagine N-glycosylation enzyme membrane subunit Stt3